MLKTEMDQFSAPTNELQRIQFISKQNETLTVKQFKITGWFIAQLFLWNSIRNLHEKQSRNYSNRSYKMTKMNGHIGWM